MSGPIGLTEYSIALRAGTMLVDQYTIVGVLGRPGGFGITYLAEDIRLDTLVAIKEFLPRELATRAPDHSTVITHSGDQDDTFHRGLDQFLREARTLAKIHHPNVVRVRQFFEANGTAYLVMDYLEGQTLADLVRERGGRLPAAEAVEIITRVLDGLDAAHALRIYHRDVKPSNIYVTSRGLPVLLDFGAARQVTGGTGMSMTAVLTPGYAPIEQYGHRGQGPWTDIYAASAVLYHMITGVDPVPASDRVGEEVDPMLPPVDIDPELSRPLSDVVMKALSMAPRDRPQSVSEFQTALKQVLTGGGTATPAAPPPTPLPALPPDTRLGEPVNLKTYPKWEDQRLPSVAEQTVKQSAASASAPEGASEAPSLRPSPAAASGRRLGRPAMAAIAVAVLSIVGFAVVASSGGEESKADTAKPGPVTPPPVVVHPETTKAETTAKIDSPVVRPKPEDRAVWAIDVRPPALQLLVGQRARIAATPRTANGRAVPSQSLRWTSQAPTVATIDDEGSVTAIAAGTATVSVSAGSASKVIRVVVTQRPSITLSSPTVGFTVVEGNRPASQTVLVGSSGSEPAAGLGVTIQQGEGGSAWLTANLSATNAPATLTLQANPGGMAPGTYAATVVLTSSSAANSPLSIPVSLAVSRRAEIVPPPPRVVGFTASLASETKRLENMFASRDRRGVTRLFRDEETDRIWKKLEGHASLSASVSVVRPDSAESAALLFVVIRDSDSKAVLHSAEYKSKFVVAPPNGWQLLWIDPQGR